MTGGTVDIGLEVTKALASAGARVVIVVDKADNSEVSIEQIRQHCRENVNRPREPHIACFECEFDSLADVKRVGDAICHQESRLDIVRILLPFAFISFMTLDPCKGDLRCRGRTTTVRVLSRQARQALRSDAPRALPPN